VGAAPNPLRLVAETRPIAHDPDSGVSPRRHFRTSHPTDAYGDQREEAEMGDRARVETEAGARPRPGRGTGPTKCDTSDAVPDRTGRMRSSDQALERSDRSTGWLSTGCA